MKALGLVIGILAVLFALVPVYGPLVATPLIVAGIALSGSSLRAGKKKGKDRRLLRAGLLLSVSAIPIMIINTVIRW